MHTTDLELINFRIPTVMKKQFQETCRTRNQQMTSVLISYIGDFINEYQPNTNEDDNQELPLGFFSNESRL